MLPQCRCDASEVVMIGDRYLTDVVYGNRNGLFTVRTKAFDLNGEPTSVLWVSYLPNSNPAS